MVIFPYKRIPQHIDNSMPKDWVIGKSESGWMVTELFYEYVANQLYKWLQENKVRFPVLLFFDGHKSHISLHLSQLCKEYKILLYCLYPNATHICQPCDVGMFKTLKVEWSKIAREKKENNIAVNRGNFAGFFKIAFDRAFYKNEGIIKNAFRVCGLYPYNPDAIDYTKCMSNRAVEISKTLTSLPNDNYEVRQLLSDIIGDENVTDFEKNSNEVNIDLLRKIFASCAVQVPDKNMTLDSASIPVQCPDNLEETDAHTTVSFDVDVERENDRNSQYEDTESNDTDALALPFLLGTINNETGEFIAFQEIESNIETSSCEVTQVTDVIQVLPETPPSIIEQANAPIEVLDLSIPKKADRATREDTLNFNNNVLFINKTYNSQPGWEKNLKYPEKNTKSRCKKNPNATPLALTSNEYIEFLEKKEAEKEENELSKEAKKKLALERNERKLEEQTAKKKAKEEQARLKQAQRTLEKDIQENAKKIKKEAVIAKKEKIKSKALAKKQVKK